MPITTSGTLFHLRTVGSSYVLEVGPTGHLLHVYWGALLRDSSVQSTHSMHARAFSPTPVKDHPWFSHDTARSEFPTYGRGDFGSPAVECVHHDGSSVVDLEYRTHRIFKGKPGLTGLPSTYVESEDEADTLELELHDKVSGVTVTLSYTAFVGYPAITRSVVVRNDGAHPVSLNRVLSASLDLLPSERNLLHLSGAWAKERMCTFRPLVQGTHSIESRRGASSHQQNPFLALVDPHTTEHVGEVRAMSLVYSGNFTAQVEVDQFQKARVQIGINPFDFSWRLLPGETFHAPEAVLVYSGEGLNGMSQAYHSLYRERLCRGHHRDRERPILVNNWEATYFTFDEHILGGLIETASELGIELFVLDDGWFGERDDDRTSLGDWMVNRRKLPGGLRGIASRANERGLQFGIWVEPEMISEDSDLYRSHPDWCLHVAGRSRTVSRNQLVLDYSRDDVCDAVINSISAILESAPITYVKWDMNRHLTEIGSAVIPPERQRETAHRHILGVYRVMNAITTRFPGILFESCSGGGGRFDPGMLYYMPQTWTSDNTDAVTRLFIQYGTSMVYPISTIGAHVSAVPNHQVHRITDLAMRGAVAMSGNLGYELDLRALTHEECDELRRQIRRYRDWRRLVQFGRFYRLRSPFEGNCAAWMFVDDERTEALVMAFRILSQPNAPLDVIRLVGVDPHRNYVCKSTHQIFGGDYLIEVGAPVEYGDGDFCSAVMHLQAE